MVWDDMVLRSSIIEQIDRHQLKFSRDQLLSREQHGKLLYNGSYNLLSTIKPTDRKGISTSESDHKNSSIQPVQSVFLTMPSYSIPPHIFVRVDVHANSAVISAVYVIPIAHAQSTISISIPRTKRK